MIMVILNYSVRIVIIVLGILFLSGAFSFTRANEDFVRIMGVIFILFGAYRLISYHSGRKREERRARKRYDFSIDNSEKDKSGDDDEIKKN